MKTERVHLFKFPWKSSATIQGMMMAVPTLYNTKKNALILKILKGETQAMIKRGGPLLFTRR